MHYYLYYSCFIHAFTHTLFMHLLTHYYVYYSHIIHTILHDIFNAFSRLVIWITQIYIRLFTTQIILSLCTRLLHAIYAPERKPMYPLFSKPMYKPKHKKIPAY